MGYFQMVSDGSPINMGAFPTGTKSCNQVYWQEDVFFGKPGPTTRKLEEIVPDSFFDKCVL